MNRICACLLGVMALTATSTQGGTLNFVTSAPQVIYTAAQRDALGLHLA